MLDPSVCLSENVEFTEGGRDLNMFTAIVLELGRETHTKKLRDRVTNKSAAVGRRLRNFRISVNQSVS
jgi:hypothetical protein